MAITKNVCKFAVRVVIGYEACRYLRKIYKSYVAVLFFFMLYFYWFLPYRRFVFICFLYRSLFI